MNNEKQIGHSFHCSCEVCRGLQYDDEGELLPEYCTVCKQFVKELADGVNFDVCEKCLKELQNDNS